MTATFTVSPADKNIGGFLVLKDGVENLYFTEQSDAEAFVAAVAADPSLELRQADMTEDEFRAILAKYAAPARDMSAWTIIDNRTDKSVTPAELFADGQWIDEGADDYEPGNLQSGRMIDDSDIHIYELQFDECVAYIAKGNGCYVREITLTDAPIKWRELLAGWDTGDSTFEELLASFGLDATSALDEAGEDHDGPCKVWIEYNFLPGTFGDTRDRYYSDPEIGDNSPTVFESFVAAQAWVDEQEDSPYYLGHGEAGRPSYTICKA